MSEFTIRNKSTNPILSLRPAVLAAMLAARPDSANLALAKYCRDYKQVTGKSINLDHEQTMVLLKHCGADEQGSWKSPYSRLAPPWFMVERSFVDGFLARSTSKGFLADLAIAEAFYSLLDPLLQTKP